LRPYDGPSRDTGHARERQSNQPEPSQLEPSWPGPSTLGPSTPNTPTSGVSDPFAKSIQSQIIRPSDKRPSDIRPTDMSPSTAYWRGASGRLYRHSAHTNVFCPAPRRGVYILARRDAEGAAVPLFAGVAASTAGTLNLAHIRRRAVTIGATEVHLCPVKDTGSIFSLRRVARDLRRSFKPSPI
jgi:hypothetical protein